ncbi:hypothetical protein K438DRAFT_1927730 [Mycena galopus ATCC 62051]|nr:hypothetical protein K438DRAFT_1927730 [Mycena galopus ATCC 62051]
MSSTKRAPGFPWGGLATPSARGCAFGPPGHFAPRALRAPGAFGPQEARVCRRLPGVLLLDTNAIALDRKHAKTHIEIALPPNICPSSPKSTLCKRRKGNQSAKEQRRTTKRYPIPEG